MPANLESLIQALTDGEREVALDHVACLLRGGMRPANIVIEGVEAAMAALDRECTAEQFNLLEVIDERDRPRREPLLVGIAGAEFTVSNGAIDALQRAKAAIGAGIEALCRRASLRLDELGAVHVAGSFGEQLDVENARRIGLLPPVPSSRVRLVQQHHTGGHAGPPAV